MSLEEYFTRLAENPGGIFRKPGGKTWRKILKGRFSLLRRLAVEFSSRGQNGESYEHKQ